MNNRYRVPLVCALGLLGTSGAVLAEGTLELPHGVTADWTLDAIAGSAVRTESPNKALLFSGNSPGGTADSAITDDGNLNFDKGDVVKATAQLYGSLDLKYANYGVFVSGMGWYDYIEDKKSVAHGNALNGYEPNTPLEDNGFDSRTRFGGATFQQAYAYGKFDVAGHPVTARVGKQLLLWGRSVFSRGSISSLNAIDLPAYHRPGSEYQQFLIPAGMLTIDAGLTDALSMKAFYQFDWQRAATDGCGTYFATFDNVSPGCFATFSSGVVQSDQASFNQGLYFRRGRDTKARNNGQGGLKLNYAFEESKANLGAYFFNYHARLPTYSVHKNANPAPSAGAPLPFSATDFFYEYPEDIRVYGLTASKTFENIGNLALDVSYIENMPLQLSTSELTSSATTTSLGAPNNPNIAGNTLNDAINTARGDDLHGFKRMGVQRAELTFTTIIPNLLGATKTVASTAAAFENIPGLPSKQDVRFGRHPNFGIGGPNAGGYITPFSWGYQLSLESTYTDVVGALGLRPSFTMREGVQGFNSDSTFGEHERAMTFGVGFDYNAISADLSYTNYNNAQFSTVRDRDYVALSTRFSF